MNWGHFKDSPCCLCHGGSMVTLHSATESVASSNNLLNCKWLFVSNLEVSVNHVRDVDPFQQWWFLFGGGGPQKSEASSHFFLSISLDLSIAANYACRIYQESVAFMTMVTRLQGSTHKQGPGGDCERAADEGRDHPPWVQLWGPQPLR